MRSIIKEEGVCTLLFTSAFWNDKLYSTLKDMHVKRSVKKIMF